MTLTPHLHPDPHPDPHPEQARPELTLAVPASWRSRQDLTRGIVIAARAPRASAGGLTPEVVLRAGPVSQPDPDTWRIDVLAEHATTTDGFVLEDDDTFDLEGRQVRYHRFAHRAPTGPGTGLGAVEAISEQWCWWFDLDDPRAPTSLGVVFTATVDRLDYLAYCDLFEDMAASFQLSCGAARP